jgi:hypothetical protein
MAAPDPGASVSGVNEDWSLEVKARLEEARDQLHSLIGTLKWMDGELQPQQVIPLLDRIIRHLSETREACEARVGSSW